MSNIFLGHCDGKEFGIPKFAFETHLHLIGGTGKGKTTAIHTMLHPLLKDHRDAAAFFIIDRMGNLSWELLLWMTSRFCPQHVRDRLIYIEPAREDVVISLNPLLHTSPQHGYYKVGRATDIILRAWEDVNIEAMPRLARWTFNAFWAAAQLGLTIADCGHLLMPGSRYHKSLLNVLPHDLQGEWREILEAKGSEATRILDSSRNRLKPFFEAPILRSMFGATQSRLDVLRFMRERRIVLINLAPQNRLSQQLGDAIGALVLNEVLSNARSLPMGVRYPTYLLLDEFQNFVGPDLESALPEVRQLKIRLILSHQSFSQLVRGDNDLSSMIWQAQSRIAFGVQGEDAEILGREFASLTFDPRRVKDVQLSTRQRIAGYRIQLLKSWSDSKTESQNWSQQHGSNWSAQKGRSYQNANAGYQFSENNGSGDSRQEGSGGAVQSGHVKGEAEHMVPIHEEVREPSKIIHYSGDDWDRVWAQRCRLLPRGVALVRLVDDPDLHEVEVQRSAVGYLSWDLEKLSNRLPTVVTAVEELKERNFRLEFFATPGQIEVETEKRLQAVLHPPFVITSQTKTGVVADDIE